MKSTSGRFQRLALATVVASASAIALVAHCSTAQARASTFEGVAGLCTFDPTGVETGQKGAISFEYGYKFYYRIQTNHELINGWETLISNTRLNPDGQAFYFGTASLEPESTPGSALEGKFFFPADANPIKGSYFGTGELSNVVVHYELFADPTIAAAYPQLCNGAAPLFGYWMYGTVQNYR